ncbi:hypothetical protein OSTOST_00709 [Ostertagia ostertagi]
MSGTNLRQRSSGSVGDFCSRMEDISSKTHPSNEWDFHLASKLYSSSEHWKDSYHLLAALETREGEIYESVKRLICGLKRLRLQDQKSKFGRPSRQALSTFVEEWCGMVRTQKPTADINTVAVGKPTLYDAMIFGIKVKARIGTGSVISTLPALLKQAKENGFDLDSEVETVVSGCKHQKFDASGNPMEFLAIVNAVVSVKAEDIVRVTMHVQKDKSNTLLLGTYVLEALGIQLRFELSIDPSQKRGYLQEHAKASRSMVIPPKAGHPLSWLKGNPENEFSASTGNSVANRDYQTRVVNKGVPFGEWSDDCSILPSKSVDMLGGMLDMQKHAALPKSKHFKVSINMLQQNRTWAYQLEHGIEVQGHPPISQKTGPVPYSIRKQVDDMLLDLKDHKIIEERRSPWASPIVLDGSTWLCIDYKEIKKVTKKDCYPLPSIDIPASHWQVPLTEKARELSAFTTTSGLFHSNVLPFGLKNAPAAFQRLMDKERHLDALKQTIEAFRKANLKVKPQKCRLMEPSLEFPGHVVDKVGIKTNPDKVGHPKVPSTTQYRSVSDLSGNGWLLPKILRYVEIAKPLYKLTSPRNRFISSEEQSKAFDKLKEALSKAPVLGQPNIKKALDRSRPFMIYTDASRIGVGAVMAQEGDDPFLCFRIFVFCGAQLSCHRSEGIRVDRA